MTYENYKGNERYLKRITSEHRVRPKYMATNKAYLDKLQDVYAFYEQILLGFDLDTAVGNQLDTLGKIVGIDRVLNFEPYYAESKLNDQQYRKLIRAKISTNQWDGTMRGLVDLWEGIFGEYTLKIFDGQDMSIIAEFSGVEDFFEAELISHGYFAPCGQGVGANYRFVMESKIDGQLYIAGMVTDEVTDYLNAYDATPKDFREDLYIGARVMIDEITDYLDGYSATPKDFKTKLYVGAGVSFEIVTDWL